MVIMSGTAESESAKAARAASMRLTVLPNFNGSKSDKVAIGVGLFELEASAAPGWRISSPRLAVLQTART